MLATLRQTAELIQLFHIKGVRKEFKKNEFIVRPGENPPGVFYIHSGFVKAYDITKYGEENLLIIRKEQEVFPLIWAISGSEQRIIYKTIAPTTALMITRDEFIDYIQTHPDALAPLLDMATDVARLHSERILTLEYRSVRERLVSFLVTMGQRFGQRTDEGLLINVPLKHQDIASSINATRETTSRELAALERKGLLVSQKSYIVLKDLKALKSHVSQ